MKSKYRNLEKGQAIVYLALGLIVFLGFVALAIDGGMALADRRNAQNAADAAALAGAGKAALDLQKSTIRTNNWSCGSVGFAMNNAEYAARSRANENGFSNVTYPRGTKANNYVQATCSNTDKYIDVTVDILSTTQSSFLQLVFPNALQNHVVAVTRIFPGGPLVNGEAIVALNPQRSPCNMETGAGFSGNANVDVHGGGIFTNGCLVGKGGSDVNAPDGNISYFTKDFQPGVFDPPPVQATDPIPPSAYDLALPDCSATDSDHNVDATDLTSPVNLDPGLWCISGNLTINSTDTFSGTRVTIFMVNGWFEVRAGAEVKLSAPAKDPDPSPAVPGLLIYLSVNNTHPVTLNGNASSTYTGTILAPGSDITVNGTSNTDAYHSQFIGYNVKVNGTSLFDIWYDPGEQSALPASLELHR